MFHKQYIVGEKTTVILYTYITLIAMQGYQTKSKNKTEAMKYIKHGGSRNIYCYIISVGWKDKATTWYLNGFPDGNSNLGSRV